MILSLLFIFGLIIGSFLNVIALRLLKEEGFIRGRSHCVFCQKILHWFELIAGVHYFLSNQNLQNFWPILIFNLIIISVLEVIFLIDLKDGVIPDILIWPFIALTLLFWWLSGGNILNYFLTGLACTAFFGLQYLVSRGRWMGLGDIGLGFLIGVFLGFPRALAALLFAYISGAIIGIFLIILNKKNWASSVPLAVFLVPSAILALFWGEKVIRWYFDI